MGGASEYSSRQHPEKSQTIRCRCDVPYVNRLLSFCVGVLAVTETSYGLCGAVCNTHTACVARAFCFTYVSTGRKMYSTNTGTIIIIDCAWHAYCFTQNQKWFSLCRHHFDKRIPSSQLEALRYFPLSDSINPVLLTSLT
jgi:hypothetical protein